MKFAIEVLSLFAFLLGSPVYLPRLGDSASQPNAAPVKTNSPSNQTNLPSTK
ncbi:MAG TPA: hypothetical protein VMU53_10065 [Candidatus Sulfotelmatobacter sp.]|nr:hypothetical protein [Candidatus Sulfotelmatobacter sp.]